ncbi:Cupin domain protein [compost metagenome]
MLLSIEPSTFKYRFEGDESWYVIKGSVTIILEDGEQVEMKAGDVISIKGGRNSTWTVHEKFEKFVVVTDGTK